MIPRRASSLRKAASRRRAWFFTAALIFLKAGPSFAAIQPPQAGADAASGVQASANAAAAPNPPALDPANLLLLSVDLDGLTLTDSLTAYGDPADPLLPVGELTRLLELDVEVSPAEGRILGRVGENRRTLVVDLATKTARDGSKAITLGPDDSAIGQADIFIRASALQKLLPISIKPDAENLGLKLAALETLPIQGRMQRMAKRREAGTDVERRDEVLSVPNPYRLLSLPAFDFIVGTGIQTTEPRFPTRYDVRVGADLLFGGFQGYVGSNERGEASTGRFTLDRRSVNGMFGPLKVRSFTLGDVFAPGLALGPRSVGGRGFTMSTLPIGQTNTFNRVDLRGELPIGYDVELYVNDVLRSGQNTPTQGRYEFLNVPLSAGVNVVRVVTYGPRGERSETTRIINVGGGQLPRGEANFEIGVVQQERPIVPFSRPDESQDTGAPGIGGWRMATNVNYGLTSTMTVAAGMAIVPTKSPGDLRQIYSAGARTSLFGIATNVDYARDERGAYAASIGLAGSFRGTSVVLRHAGFANGFIDENGPGADLTRPMRNRTELSIDGNIGVGGAVVPVSFRTLYNTFANGQSELTASTRASATVRGILMSAGAELADTRVPGFGSNRRLNGYLAGSTLGFSKWQIRSTLDFEIVPALKARSLAITADREISDFASLRLGVSETLDDLNSFSLTAASIFRMKFGDLSLTGNYNNFDRSWTAGVQLSFGLEYNPALSRYAVTRPGPGSGGSVLFEAFLDANGNGVFDPGEEPVANVAVEGSERRAVTGKDGKVFITGLGSNVATRLMVNLDNVENTSVQTPPANLQIAPRPGSLTVVRYPMRPTVELLVRIMLKRDDGTRVGLSAVNVALVRDGEPPVEGKTEYDGTANFANLTAGTYQLQLDQEQAKRLRMVLITPVTVVVKGAEGFLPDVEAEVKFAPRTEEQQKAAATAG